MAFRGFLIESKSFLHYEGMTKKEKLFFWLEYPKAFIKFTYYNWRYENGR